MTSSNDAAGGGVTSCTVPDHFDPENVEDASDPYPRPLFIVPLPPLACQKAKNGSDDDGKADVLAYGGSDGKVYLIANNDEEPKVVHDFSNDGDVRAIAVSPDGLRIAVGLEEGSTKIFSYDDFVPDDSDNDGGRVHHPFAAKKAANDDDDEVGGLSQLTQGGVREFDGPRVDAAVRQLAFDPRCGGKKGEPYYLAIVSEDGNKPLVICDVKDGDSAETLYLEEKGFDECDGGGVRSVAYSMPEEGNKGNVLLATLDMKGRLVTWDVTSFDDPELEWDVVRKDFAVYAADDGGEGMGDAGAKACRVVWDAYGESDERTAALFLPGKTEIQYRLCPMAKTLSTSECVKHFEGPPKFLDDAEGRGHKDTIVAMASQPGKKVGSETILVTGGRDGKLLLWELNLGENQGRVVKEFELKRKANTSGIPPITSIVWQKEDELHVAFADGTVLTVPVDVEEALKASEGKAEEAMEDVSQDVDEDEDLATQPATPADDDAAEKSSEKSPKKSPKKKQQPADDEDSDDYDDMSDDEGEKRVTFKKKIAETKDEDNGVERIPFRKKKDASKFVDDQAQDGDDSDGGEVLYDDVVVAPSEDADAQGKDKEDDEISFGADDDPIDFDAHRALARAACVPSEPPQPPFAPSSTPFEAHGHRILCWNQVGTVTIRRADDGKSKNVVDVQFHETAGFNGGRRPVTIDDEVGFIVGALGEEGVFLGSDVQEEAEDEEEADDDMELQGIGVISAVARKAVKEQQQSKRRKAEGDKGSRLYFGRFETFGRYDDKNWRIDLPTGERALGTATGTGFCAAVTSRRFLRLFTVSGLQGPVIWIAGEPVTVVGRDRFVAVFYHRSTGPSQDGTQLLGYSVYDGLTGATIANGELSALSPGASLTWAGFSEKCALSVMDSDGVLSMLARHPNGTSNTNNGNWMPVLDTVGVKRSPSDSYWPVEVHGGKLVCLYLRGGRMHPDPIRRPVTTTLRLRIPFAAGLTGNPLEEGSVRAIFALNQGKVFDDYLVSLGGEVNEEDLEEEYHQTCVKVDKVTLSLFRSTVEAGKIERAYDLVHRLHTEKTMGVAVDMADRLGHRKLSDRIDRLRLDKYPPIGEDEEAFSDDDGASFDSGRRSERSGSFDEDEPVIATRQQRLEMSQTRISPTSTPPQAGSRGGAAEESDGGDYPTTDEESPPKVSPKESLKRKFRFAKDDAPAASKKRMNPFAKKVLASPAKGIAKVGSSPTKLSLSRNSTFSAGARKKQRSGKQIM